MATTGAAGVPLPRSQPAGMVLQAAGTIAAKGLAKATRERGCPVEAERAVTAKAIPPWRRLLAQLVDPLVILLLIATVISAIAWALERDTAWPYEAIAILAVVILNALMGYVQESRAEQAVRRCADVGGAGHVVRDGTRRASRRPSSSPATSSSSKRATRSRPTRG